MRIFISYRREDSGGYAGRLYDRLSEHFGAENTFMDISAIEPGQDFVEVIRSAVASCEVLIALVGKRWLGITDSSGKRRIDNPNDFVRIEITAALERGIRVIPTLVGGAPIPKPGELPAALSGLVRRQALELSDTRFHHDVDRLIQTLESLEPIPPSRGAPAPPREAPPPRLEQPPPAQRPGVFRSPLFIVGLVGILAVIAVFTLYLAFFRPGPGDVPITAPTPTEAVPTALPATVPPISDQGVALPWMVIGDRVAIDPEGSYWEKYEADLGLPGLYLRTDDISAFGDYLELNADETFILEENGEQRTGTWQADNEKVILTFP